MNDYIPVYLLFGLGIAMAGGLLTLSYVLGPKVHKHEKLDTYECGMPPRLDARRQFSIKYYVIAVLFIVFDIETVYLIPLSTVYRNTVSSGHGLFIFCEMILFMALLIAGFIYIYKARAIEWDMPDD